MAQTLLSVRDLSVFFGEGRNELQITRDIGFDIARGERVGLVGESGCGKTVTGLALTRLLPDRLCRIAGSAVLGKDDILALPESRMRKVRGRRIGMIFQEPMSALDPVFTVGEQIIECIVAHFGVTKAEAPTRAIEVLRSVGIPLPEQRVDQYPHELSGGMRQRAMIAIALAAEPEIIIADEPTTALDVTIQAQILDLLRDLSARTGTSMVFITHDLGVVADCCDRVIVMYAGEIVEDAPVDALLEHPMHPYTSALLGSIPRHGKAHGRLTSIPGRVPAAADMPGGCRFAPRCAHAIAACEAPQQLETIGDHRVRCCRAHELALAGAVA